MPSNTLVLTTLAIAGGAAAVVDLRTRRVPNALTVSLAASGVASAASGFSGLTLGASLAGFALGLLLMLPGHVIAGTGAGDVKLFAASGTLIGPVPIVTAFLYTALVGGVLALVVAVRRRRLQRTLEATAGLVTGSAAHAADIEHPHANNRFAYAPAIAIGTLAAALGL
jgi:prepilin peptidase CpaA